MRSWPVRIVVLALVAAGIGLLLLERRGSRVETTPAEEALEALVESPRPAVRAEPPWPTLRGTPTATRAASPREDRAALLEERNELARAHRAVVVRYENGLASIQEVEDAEVRLLGARHRLGEIDGPTWHRARAVLIARAAEGTRLLVEAGMLPALDLERVRLSLELERLLAGDPDTYAASRDAFFSARREWHAALVAAGREAAADGEEDLARLETELPPADVARSRDR